MEFKAPPREGLPLGKKFASDCDHGAVCDSVCLLLQTMLCVQVLTPKRDVFLTFYLTKGNSHVFFADGPVAAATGVATL